MKMRLRNMASGPRAENRNGTNGSRAPPTLLASKFKIDLREIFYHRESGGKEEWEAQRSKAAEESQNAKRKSQRRACLASSAWIL
jgi:hypothetical protein